jgi:hypothetical protein
MKNTVGERGVLEYHIIIYNSIYVFRKDEGELNFENTINYNYKHVPINIYKKKK